jgi:periplasmic divalent cation tolerance protein
MRRMCGLTRTAQVFFTRKFFGIYFSVGSVDSVAIRGFHGHSWIPWPFNFWASLRYIPIMRHDPQIVLCTVPDEMTARRVATTLVEERLAACVNIVPGLTSIYRWQEAVESAAELLLIIKTGTSVYTQLQDRIRALHPYELPEIIAVSPAGGLPDYFTWITNALE